MLLQTFDLRREYGDLVAVRADAGFLQNLLPGLLQMAAMALLNLPRLSRQPAPASLRR